MRINFNSIVAILAVVISQSVFISGMLWTARRNRTPNRLLAVLLFGIALWLSDDFMRASGIYRQDPDLYFLPLFYSLGFGPLIYFYLLSLINGHFRFRKVHALHFLPVLLQAGLYGYLCLRSYAFKHWYWTNIHEPYTYRLEFDGTWISLMVYLLLSLRLLRRYQRWVADNFSELSRIRLQWLKVILGLLIVLCLQWLAEVILRDKANSYFDYNYSVELLGIAGLVMEIFGLRQRDLPAMDPAAGAPDSEQPVFEADPRILDQITHALATERAYLDPTLSLAQLAAATGLSPKVVSRHINAGFQRSFNDLVNHYRVEEVKRRLATPDLQRMTILAIAYESGFNSKTTFNRIFKQFTGSAPSGLAAGKAGT